MYNKICGLLTSKLKNKPEPSLENCREKTYLKLHTIHEQIFSHTRNYLIDRIYIFVVLGRQIIQTIIKYLFNIHVRTTIDQNISPDDS